VALNHNGPGTTVLPGDNSYTGATTINAGTLVINGMNLSAVTINGGGTLGGIGTINNVVNVMGGGTIAPGNSIGTLTVEETSPSRPAQFSA
jgi:autotransporter-associated beta strand protein